MCFPQTPGFANLLLLTVTCSISVTVASVPSTVRRRYFTETSMWWIFKGSKPTYLLYVSFYLCHHGQVKLCVFNVTHLFSCAVTFLCNYEVWFMFSCVTWWNKVSNCVIFTSAACFLCVSVTYPVFLLKVCLWFRALFVCAELLAEHTATCVNQTFPVPAVKTTERVSLLITCHKYKYFFLRRKHQEIRKPWWLRTYKMQWIWLEWPLFKAPG